ncbi:ATP-binding protein [Bradyrhizobium sp. Rc2d]|uniref:GAF domain-containing sensor histidine kinase n=1 Tax=Bradyrhizobium sp. Rc2d TaxID=1855321 RepID=UPI0015A1F4DC|nr:ATP-binding protein [Bradyrhizobium sp. Rc2d]
MPNSVQVPADIMRKWQEIVDLLADILNVPSALIMRAEPPNIKVFVSSESNENPYEPGEVACLNTGLYCETVMSTRRPLIVPDALQDEAWKSNPDVKLGMISYLGVPISWPDGEIFGTICVLDKKSNEYSELYLRLLLQWRDVLQADLRSIASMQREIEQREAKIRRLVDANIIGIVIWNMEGQILDANNEFLRIVGYDQNDVLCGRVSWADMTPPEWRVRNAQALSELKNKRAAQPFEKEYIRKDGSRVPVLVGIASLEGTEGQGVAFVLDLTERKRAETEARESERRFRNMQMELAHANRLATLGQLAASITHEVKQPITAALLNTQTAQRFLTRQQPDVERAKKAIDRAVLNGMRVSEVVDRTHALVRKEPVQKDRLEINDAISGVIGLTRGEASKNDVQVRTQLAEDLPVIQGSRVQIQQVMLNLIVNAVEAMSQMSDDRRELLISTQAEADCVLVSVRDSGPGLSEDAIEQVFEAFYTTKSSGLGMGLSVCRSIVEDHGGRLWATTNVPRGAAFQFTVPINADCQD